MTQRTTPAAPEGRPLALAGLLGAFLAMGPAAQAQTPVVPNASPAAALGNQVQPPTGPWTLQRAVDYAVQNNLVVRQSELTAQQQEALQRLNRAALLPTAGINANQGF